MTNSLFHRWCRGLVLAATFSSLTPISRAQTTLQWEPLGEPAPGGAVTGIRVSPFDSNRVIAGGDMLGAVISFNAGESWNATSGLKNFECGDFTWHPTNPDVVWVGTMGGPYKGSIANGKLTWSSKRVGMPQPASGGGYTAPIQKILFDPTKPSRLIAIGGSWRQWAENVGANPSYMRYGAIWESLDAGENWTLKHTINGDGNGKGSNIMSAAFAGEGNDTLYALVKGSGIIKCTNASNQLSSWSAVNTGLPNPSAWANDRSTLAAHPTDGNTLFVSVRAGGVYKTTDGGANWTQKSSGLALFSNAYYYSVTISKSSPQILYTVNTEWGRMYRSTNGGDSWTQVGDINSTRSPTPEGFKNWIEIDPSNSQVVYGCSNVHIMKTTNGGSSWIDTTNTLVYDGWPGNIKDDTSRWRGRGFGGLIGTRFVWNPYNLGSVFLCALDDAKGVRSTDDLASWQRMTGQWNWGGASDITFANDGATIYCLGYWNKALWKTTNGGALWNTVSVAWPSGGQTQSLYVMPDDPARLWLVQGNGLYKSTNSGASWTQISVTNQWNSGEIVHEITGPENNTSSNNTLYAFGKHGVYRSVNGGAFLRMNDPDGSASSLSGQFSGGRIKFKPGDPSVLYVAATESSSYNKGGVWRYANGAWTRIFSNIRAADVAINPINTALIAVVTDEDPYRDETAATGVWFTSNGNDPLPDWTQQNTGLVMTRGSVITFSPEGTRLVVGLNGGGFFKAPVWPGIVSGGTYELKPECAPTTCLEITNAAYWTGAQAQIWNDSNVSHQRWLITDVGNGYYKLNPVHAPSKALDVNGASSSNGAKIQLWNDNGTSAQRWKFVNLDNGYWRLEPECAPQSCLDVTNGGTTNGTTTQLWSISNSTSKRWKLEKQ